MSTSNKKTVVQSTRKQPSNSVERVREKTAATEGGKALSGNLFLFGAIFMLSLGNMLSLWYGMTGKTEVIAITESGEIINPVPLPEAFVNDARVLSFVDECVRASFSHDFENYRRTVNDAKTCYTDQGSKSFTTAFEPMLQSIINRRLVMTVSTETPVVVRGPYLERGRATWEVQTVVTMFFHGTTERFNQPKRVATVKVVRVPLAESLSGVGVDSIQLAPYTETSR